MIDARSIPITSPKASVSNKSDRAPRCCQCRRFCRRRRFNRILSALSYRSMRFPMTDRIRMRFAASSSCLIWSLLISSGERAFGNARPWCASGRQKKGWLDIFGPSRGFDISVVSLNRDIRLFIRLTADFPFHRFCHLQSRQV